MNEIHEKNNNKAGPQIGVRNWKLFFLFLNQNICCGYSKEPRWDGSFQHPKHMFKLMDKKIMAILRIYFWFNWLYVLLFMKKNHMFMQKCKASVVYAWSHNALV